MGMFEEMKRRLNGAFHEDDKDLYVIAGMVCSGFCVGIVFIVWLIVRLIV